MKSKYTRLKFIEKHHLLPVIASIPSIMLLFHLLFPTVERFICNLVTSDTLEWGVFVFILTLFICAFHYGLCLIYLVYRYLKSIRREEPLPTIFWIVNAYLNIKVFIIYISVYLVESTRTGSYEFASKPIYVIVLFIIGWCCSSKSFKKDKLLIFFLFFVFIVSARLSYFLGINYQMAFQLIWYTLFFSEILLMKQLFDKPYLADKWIGFKLLLLLCIIISLTFYLTIYIAALLLLY